MWANLACTSPVPSQSRPRRRIGNIHYFLVNDLSLSSSHISLRCLCMQVVSHRRRDVWPVMMDEVLSCCGLRCWRCREHGVQQADVATSGLSFAKMTTVNCIYRKMKIKEGTSYCCSFTGDNLSNSACFVLQIYMESIFQGKVQRFLSSIELAR